MKLEIAVARGKKLYDKERRLPKGCQRRIGERIERTKEKLLKLCGGVLVSTGVWSRSSEWRFLWNRLKNWRVKYKRKEDFALAA